MDQNQFSDQSGTGSSLLAVTMISGVLGHVFAFFSMLSFHDLLSDASLFVSIAAGLLAARHYWLTDKKQK